MKRFASCLITMLLVLCPLMSLAKEKPAPLKVFVSLEISDKNSDNPTKHFYVVFTPGSVKGGEEVRCTTETYGNTYVVNFRATEWPTKNPSHPHTWEWSVGQLKGNGFVAIISGEIARPLSLNAGRTNAYMGYWSFLAYPTTDPDFLVQNAREKYSTPLSCTTDRVN